MTLVSRDIIGIYDSNFNQLFTGARPVNVRIKENSRTMKYPLETGVTITDHFIIEPIEIEFQVILQADDYYQTYQNIKRQRNLGTLFLVQTKTSVYQNMMIQEIPHEESADFYNAIPMNIRMVEALFAGAEVSNYAPVQTADPTTTEEEKQSTAVSNTNAGLQTMTDPLYSYDENSLGIFIP